MIKRSERFHFIFLEDTRYTKIDQAGAGQDYISTWELAFASCKAEFIYEFREAEKLRICEYALVHLETF